MITADVIGSRSYPPSGESLKSWLEQRIAQLSDPSLVVRFSVSQGDEVQGVCRGPLAQPGLVRRLRYACRPLGLRIGIGVGEVGELEPQPPGDGRAATEGSALPGGSRFASSWDMTGPAFFLAREALDLIGGAKGPKTRVRLPDERLELAINTIYELVDAFMADWTEAQWEAVHAYEEAGTYQAAARVLKVAFQNVEKRCRAAHWPLIREAEAALSRLASFVC